MFGNYIACSKTCSFLTMPRKTVFLLNLQLTLDYGIMHILILPLLLRATKDHALHGLQLYATEDHALFDLAASSICYGRPCSVWSCSILYMSRKTMPRHGLQLYATEDHALFDLAASSICYGRPCSVWSCSILYMPRKT